jgi:hypothetical protein
LRKLAHFFGALAPMLGVVDVAARHAAISPRFGCGVQQKNAR